MPFHGLGENGRDKLGQSIAEGLSTELSQLPGAQIGSFEPTRAYSAPDEHQIHRERGVSYIVDGSVASDEAGLHAETRLVNTRDDTVASALTVRPAQRDDVGDLQGARDVHDSVARCCGLAHYPGFGDVAGKPVAYQEVDEPTERFQREATFV